MISPIAYIISPWEEAEKLIEEKHPNQFSWLVGSSFTSSNGYEHKTNTFVLIPLSLKTFQSVSISYEHENGTDSLDISDNNYGLIGNLIAIIVLTIITLKWSIPNILNSFKTKLN